MSKKRASENKTLKKRKKQKHSSYPETATKAFEWLMNEATHVDKKILSRYFPKLVSTHSAIKALELADKWEKAGARLLTYGRYANPFTILVQALWNKRKHERNHEYGAVNYSCNSGIGVDRELFLLYFEAIPELWVQVDTLEGVKYYKKRFQISVQPAIYEEHERVDDPEIPTLRLDLHTAWFHLHGRMFHLNNAPASCGKLTKRYAWNPECHFKQVNWDNDIFMLMGMESLIRARAQPLILFALDDVLPSVLMKMVLEYDPFAVFTTPCDLVPNLYVPHPGLS